MNNAISVELESILEVALPDASRGAIRTLVYLCENDGVTIHRIAKDVGLGESLLRRALSELGESAGAGLVKVEPDGKVRLTEMGRKIRG